jgi:hypothetical protein
LVEERADELNVAVVGSLEDGGGHDGSAGKRGAFV